MTRAWCVAALLLGVLSPIGSARAQAQEPASASPQSSGSASGASSAPANSSKPKPKKVWTNDNVGEASGSISVVGSASSSGNAGAGGGNAKGRSAATPAAKSSVDPKVIASLREQLRRLDAQLGVVDHQLADLKGASKGDSKNTGGVRQDTWTYDSSSVEEQIQHLQEKKKRLESTIDELLDAARKAGIEPGQLR
jgi:hypothetical protein